VISLILSLQENETYKQGGREEEESWKKENKRKRDLFPP
jgi:hypothetical protein